MAPHMLCWNVVCYFFIIFFLLIQLSMLAKPMSDVFNLTLHHVAIKQYVVSVSIGSPPQEEWLVLDTGSNLVWLQCNPCQQCLRQHFPAYNSSMSSTYEEIDCHTTFCSDEVNGFHCNDGNTCIYHVRFTGNAMTEGKVAFEKLNGSPIDKLVFGCAKTFKDNGRKVTDFAGIAGIGRGPFSLPAQLNASAFSICLFNYNSRKSSIISFYRSSPPVPDGSVVIPMFSVDRFSHAYYVTMIGISIGSKMVPINSSLDINEDRIGGTIVDTGYTFTAFPPVPYKTFRNYLRNAVDNSTLVNGEIFNYMNLDTCYYVGPTSNLNKLPSVSMSFSNGVTLDFNPHQIMIPSPSSRKGVFCSIFIEQKVAHIILGNQQLQGMLMTIDTLAMTLALKPGSC